jgi:hypothetical protein
MSTRWVAALGGAASFVVAAIVGVVGSQLGTNAGWAWLAFCVALILGGAVTGWTAYRIAKSGSVAHCGGDVRHAGDATVGRVSANGGQAAGINYGTMSQTHHPDASR